MSKKTLKIAHSPDADDHFMFWALATGAIRSELFDFHITQADTQSLNHLAETHDYDIIAVSAAHYPKVQAHYQPLRMGSSVGSGYGPVLVTTKDDLDTSSSNLTEALKDSILLTPGRHTTAHNALKALGFTFDSYREIPISPMTLVFEELEALAEQARRGSGPRPVALLIHEGRLLYENFGTQLLLDLGLAWHEHFQCDLPLGINVIRRSLSPQEKSHLSQLLKESMQEALREQARFEEDYLAKGCPLSREDLKTYLNMYANETTLDIKPEHREAFEVLMSTVQGESKAQQPTDWI